MYQLILQVGSALNFTGAFSRNTNRKSNKIGEKLNKDFSLHANTEVTN
jgi:hypothetical protein